jgi:ribonucleotide monophosphatase NagD (HAD superfamily)
LNRHRDDVLGEKAPKLQKVYMIGDNPASDIKGANDFQSPEGTEWESIFVETGVYKAGSTPKHVPTTTVHGVLNAVKWALEREGYANAGDLA